MNNNIKILKELYNVNDSFVKAYDKACLTVEQLVRDPLEDNQSFFVRHVVCFEEAYRLARKARGLKREIKINRVKEGTPDLTIANESLASFGDKLFSDEELPFDKFLNFISPNQTNQLVDESDDLVSQVFYNWFSGADYINKYLEVKPLITPVPISPHLGHLLDAAVRSYIFDIHAGVACLCRAVVDKAMQDIRKDASLKKRRRSGGKKLGVSELLSAGDQYLESRIDSLKKELDLVIHAKEKPKGDSLRVLHQTFDLVRDLYLVHFSDSKLKGLDSRFHGNDEG